MPWKMDGESVAIQDGHPVWVYDDGKESPFDAGSALNTIKTLTGESVSRKKKIQEIESKLELFKDIENPEEYLTKANKALETVKNMKDKDFIAAGEVEQLKRGVAESYETKIRELEKGYKTQLDEREKLIQAKDEGIHKLLVKGAFAQSDFIRHKTVLPPDMAFDSFGRYFQIEEVEGQPQAVAVRPNGEKIFSLREPGSYASTDEAIEILISERKDKDAILRGNPGGSGSQQSMSPQGTLSRDEMMKLSPIERINAARRGAK